MFYLNKAESKWKWNETRNRSNNLALLLSTTRKGKNNNNKNMSGDFHLYKCTTSKESISHTSLILACTTSPPPPYIFSLLISFQTPFMEQYRGGGSENCFANKGWSSDGKNNNKYEGKFREEKKGKIFVTLRAHYFFPH